MLISRELLLRLVREAGAEPRHGATNLRAIAPDEKVDGEQFVLRHGSSIDGCSAAARLARSALCMNPDAFSVRLDRNVSVFVSPVDGNAALCFEGRERGRRWMTVPVRARRHDGDSRLEQI